MFKKIFIGFLFLILWFVYDLCVERSFLMQIKLSSDGHYAISTHHGGYLMLWDLEKKTRKTIGKYPNIYSVYFIPDTHNFLWQRVKDNEVIVQNVEGKVIKTFNPGFPVYGHVMQKDLSTYITSDMDWNLYFLDQKRMKRFQEDHGGFLGGMKLLGLNLSENYLLTTGVGNLNGEQYPITIGRNERQIRRMKIPDRINDSLLEGVALWDLKTHKPLKKFIGNIQQTDGGITADEKTVIAGDENSFMYSWDVDSGIRRRMDEPANPDFNCGIDEECWEALRKQLGEDVPRPKDFYTHNQIHSTSNLAVRFIDEKHFLRFVMEVNYAILYSVDSPKILAYIDLGQNPKPQSFFHADANMIDTAPKAKALVMGQNFMNKVPISKGTGIIVYKYDNEKKQLQRVWTPDGPSWHMNWNKLLNLLTAIFLNRSNYGP